jgi:hypothetical protein
MADAVTKKTQVRALMIVPLLLLTLFVSFSYLKSPFKFWENWTWFNYHPLFMAIAVVPVSSLAVLTKKIGGYDNTKSHGNLLLLSFIASSFGLYVIWSNKELLNKPHFKTTHGKLGLLVMISYFSLMIFGVAALHPDLKLPQFERFNATLRIIHRWSGRVVMALAWLCVFTGYSTKVSEWWYQTCVAVPLLVFAYIVLL